MTSQTLSDSLQRSSRSVPPRGPFLAFGLVLLVLGGCATTGGETEGAAAAAPAAQAPNLERAREAFLEKDYALSAHLLEQLARQGDPAAQYGLGYLHYYGLGVPQDTEMALLWIRRAADNGYEDAGTALLRFSATRKPPSGQPDDDVWIEERGLAPNP